MKNLAGELEKLNKENLYRSRRLLSSAQQIEPVINGQKVLSFCSNDYLGLANHPKVVERFISTVKQFGVGAGASHLITGHHKCHSDLEEELAKFFGCEKVLLFSAGYMANLGVVSSLANRNSIIFADKLNHASLNDAAIQSQAKLKRYSHRDTEELEKLISNYETSNKLILSDGVFSMDGTIAPIKEVQAIAKSYDATLIIDDAHGIGIIGSKGKGCTEDLLQKNNVLVGTLGKAFGTFGAFVAAKQEIIEWLIQRAHSYIYTTALPPAIAEATRASLEIIKEENWRRENLSELITYFKTSCKQVGIKTTNSTTAIQPIIIGNKENTLKVSEQLLKNDILVPAIRPPTVPKNTSRLRISLCATHTNSHLDQLVDSLHRAMN